MASRIVVEVGLAHPRARQERERDVEDHPGGAEREVHPKGRLPEQLPPRDVPRRPVDEEPRRIGCECHEVQDDLPEPELGRAQRPGHHQQERQSSEDAHDPEREDYEPCPSNRDLLRHVRLVQELQVLLDEVVVQLLVGLRRPHVVPEPVDVERARPAGRGRRPSGRSPS